MFNNYFNCFNLFTNQNPRYKYISDTHHFENNTILLSYHVLAHLGTVPVCKAATQQNGGGTKNIYLLVFIADYLYLHGNVPGGKAATHLGNVPGGKAATPKTHIYIYIHLFVFITGYLLS